MRLQLAAFGHIDTRTVAWFVALFLRLILAGQLNAAQVADGGPMAFERLHEGLDPGPMPFDGLSVSTDRRWLRVQPYGSQKYYFFNLARHRFEWESPGWNYGKIGSVWSEDLLVIETSFVDKVTSFVDARTVFYRARLDGKRPVRLFEVPELAWGCPTSGGQFVLSQKSMLTEPKVFWFFDLDRGVLEPPQSPLPPKTVVHASLRIPGDEGFAILTGSGFSITTGVLLAYPESKGGFKQYDFQQALSDALKLRHLDAASWRTAVRLTNDTACIKDKNTLRFLTVSHAKSRKDTDPKCIVWDYDLAAGRIHHIADLTIPARHYPDITLVQDYPVIRLSPSGNWVLAVSKVAESESQPQTNAARLVGSRIRRASVILQRVGEERFHNLPITVDYEYANINTKLDRVRFLSDTDLVYLKVPHEIRRYSITDNRDFLLYSFPARSSGE